MSLFNSSDQVCLDSAPKHNIFPQYHHLEGLKDLKTVSTILREVFLLASIIGDHLNCDLVNILHLNYNRLLYQTQIPKLVTHFLFIGKYPKISLIMPIHSMDHNLYSNRYEKSLFRRLRFFFLNYYLQSFIDKVLKSQEIKAVMKLKAKHSRATYSQLSQPLSEEDTVRLFQL